LVENKTKVLNNIKDGWMSLQSVLNFVPESIMEDSGVIDGWSVKDIIGHITTWEDIIIDIIQAKLSGGEYIRPYEDLNDFNVQEVEMKKPLSLGEIKHKFLKSHEYLIKFLNDLPEYVFEASSESVRVISVESWNHYQEHAQDIKKWLNSRS